MTLLTDYGREDYYEILLRGHIYQACSEVEIISHYVKKFDVAAAGFSLSQYYQAYPEGTLHVVLVNDSLPSRQEMILFKFETSYLLTFNNGIVSYVREKPLQQWKVSQSGIVFPSFKELDLVRLVVSAWGKGDIETAFFPIEEYEQSTFLRPILEKNRIVGHIIYIDSYGNCITNIHIDDFSMYSSFRHSEVIVGKYVIADLVRDYAESAKSDLVALFGLHGYLEIAIVQEQAQSLIGLKVGTTIRIEFY